MRNKPIKRSRLKNQQTGTSWRTYLLVGASAVGVIILGYLLYLSIQDPQTLDGIRRSVGLSRGHDEEVEYLNTGLPPVGGIHSGVWQNCGIYDQPIDPKNAVHSMEHGAVWIAYDPGLAAEDVETLQEQVADESYVLLTPYPDLQSPVVLTAWGVQLEVEDADDGRIADFVDTYQQGPQTPELGATCSDGLGTPINLVP